MRLRTEGLHVELVISDLDGLIGQTGAAADIMPVCELQLDIDIIKCLEPGAWRL